MAGKTVSAYADEVTAAKIAEMARLEDRSPAQIAAAALRLYVRLPPAAREAWRRVEVDAGPAAADAAAWAAGRALLDRQYDAALAAGLAAMPTPDPALVDEDAILTRAIQLTRAP